MSTVRNAWADYHSRVSAQAHANKQSQDAVVALCARYRALSAEERAMVDEVLAEQTGSADESVRFDALALIREFGIVSAVPALRSLADRLELDQRVGAPYEWAKVNRLIGELATRGDGSGPSAD